MIGQILNTLFNKFAALLDILDLSFFVAGAASFSAFLYWAHIGDWELPVGAVASPIWVFYVLASYVFGLVSFSIGRNLRKAVRKILRLRPRSNNFELELEGHALDCDRRFAPYCSKNVESIHQEFNFGRLYVRMWAEIRQDRELEPSFSLIRRYWVMTATYDGLTAASVLWAVVMVAYGLGIGVANTGGPWHFAVAGFLFLVATICAIEAQRLANIQSEELLASLATKRQALEEQASDP